MSTEEWNSRVNWADPDDALEIICLTPETVPNWVSTGRTMRSSTSMGAAFG